MNNVPQPHYPDGTKAWAVDAIRPGGSQRRITTTYVRAPTAKRAGEAGKHRLRNLIKAHGYRGGWRVNVRAADPVHDLGMTDLETSDAR